MHRTDSSSVVAAAWPLSSPSFAPICLFLPTFYPVICARPPFLYHLVVKLVFFLYFYLLSFVLTYTFVSSFVYMFLFAHKRRGEETRLTKCPDAHINIITALLIRPLPSSYGLIQKHF